MNAPNVPSQAKSPIAPRWQVFGFTLLMVVGVCANILVLVLTGSGVDTLIGLGVLIVVLLIALAGMLLNAKTRRDRSTS